MNLNIANNFVTQNDLIVLMFWTCKQRVVTETCKRNEIIAGNERRNLKIAGILCDDYCCHFDE